LVVRHLLARLRLAESRLEQRTTLRTVKCGLGYQTILKMIVAEQVDED